MGISKPSPSRLTVFIHIIVLDLAEIPGVDIHQAAEHIRIAVVGKTYLTDGAALLFLSDPFQDSQRFKPFPRMDIRQHMHQIVIHMVCAQPAQLLIKILVQTGSVLYQIMGQLGSDIYPVPYPIPLQYLPQSRLAAAVDISRIKIIHAAPVGGHDLLLGFFQIDPARSLGKAHTAIPQHGELISIFILTILHPYLVPHIAVLSHDMVHYAKKRLISSSLRSVSLRPSLYMALSLRGCRSSLDTLICLLGRSTSASPAFSSSGSCFSV